MHHTIEEREIFPILAKRMPDFDHNVEGVHLKSHEGIHDGELSITLCCREVEN